MINNPFSHPNRIFKSGFYKHVDLDFEVRTTLGRAASGSAEQSAARGHLVSAAVARQIDRTFHRLLLEQEIFLSYV